MQLFLPSGTRGGNHRENDLRRAEEQRSVSGETSPHRDQSAVMDYLNKGAKARRPRLLVVFGPTASNQRPQGLVLLEYPQLRLLR